MPSPYIPSHQAERKKRETPEFILKCIKTKGWFCVSWRYRDDWLEQRCSKLQKAGVIKIHRQWSGKGFTYYIAGPNFNQLESPNDTILKA